VKIGPVDSEIIWLTLKKEENNSSKIYSPPSKFADRAKKAGLCHRLTEWKACLLSLLLLLSIQCKYHIHNSFLIFTNFCMWLEMKSGLFVAY